MPAPSAPPTLTAPPTAPSRNDAPPTFISRMNAFLAWIITFVSEMGTMATALYDYATSAYTDTQTATTKAGEANASAEAASDFADAAGESATNAGTSETNAANSAAAAAASANTADGFRATSTSSVAIGLGAKSLTLAQTGKLFTAGSYVQIVDAADPTNFMTALISTFSAGTGAMTVDVKGIGGSGTKTSWTVSLAGAPGGAASAGTLAGVLNFAPTVTVASASTTDIGGANSNNVSVTGTTTITSFGSSAAAPEGSLRNITFTGTLTLTHNATSLILPGGANITTAAGDTAVAKSLGSGNWRVISYTRASGLPVTVVPAPTGYVAVTGAYTVTAADWGKIIDCTSGTFTLTFNSASTLGSGFYCYVRNSGTGTISGPTADGSTVTWRPGDVGIISSDGSTLHHMVLRRLWNQVATPVTISGSPSTITFSGWPSDLDDLAFDFDSVTTSTSATLRISLSSDGTSFSTDLALQSASGSQFNGRVYLQDIRNAIGMIQNSLANGTLGAAPVAISASNNTTITRRNTGPITHVRFSMNIGTFSNGTITPRGR